MKTFFTLHVTSCEKHRMEWRLRPAVAAAAVTIHVKPHAQQQLARDLEVERAAMGSSVGLKVSARCSEAIPSYVDGCISVELQLCYCRNKSRVRASHSPVPKFIMRQGRGSEATEIAFCLQAKKPLHNGSYEHRVPEKQNKTFFCTCLIQHRNWPLRSTILNVHGTNASPDGLCTRTHTNEAFSCWFCCKSFTVDRASRGQRVFIMRKGRESEAPEGSFEACLGRF